tara:strand:+ start:1598 stop:2647 length:1050 start_codon:yes stop_codon:yes gene_type:complete
MAAYTTIDDPSLYFDTLSYTGDMSTDRDITGLGFQPDFVWVKNRATTNYHNIKDSVRGTSVVIFANNSDAEISDSDRVTAFLSNGFTVSNSADTNGSGNSMVAWCWKAGTTSGITTTSSTITHIGYSFNQTSGFSIVRYHGNETAGAKIPHGLAQKPAMIILKNLNNTEQWCVYHHKNTSAPATDYLLLDVNSATADDNTIWNDTEPDTVNVTLGGDDIVNKNGEDLVGYIFAEKQGYSKFGSYSGNNNSNGPMIWTGMKPAFVMTKKSDGTDNWILFDNKRSPFNPVDDQLYADLPDAEADANAVDFLSNGFKFRGNGGGYNGNNDYIYMAFAEAPFVNSNGVPCNAR